MFFIRIKDLQKKFLHTTIYTLRTTKNINFNT